MGVDSVVGAAIRCGLDGPGFESCWKQYFQHPSRLGLDPIHSPTQWVPGDSQE